MRRLLALTILLLRVTEGLLGNGQTCRYGPDCQYDCNCAGNCAPETGCVGNCTRGWDGPTCQRRNVAIDQQTSQSSNWPQYTSRLAVDGKVGHTLETTPCTHTQSDYQSWWTVTLDGTYSIYRFQIYNRKGDCNPNVACGSRLNGFTLSVGNNNQSYSTCYTDTTTSVYGPGDIINGRCNDSYPGIGNVVQISLPSSSYWPLTLCEVLLFVCSHGWYGEMCDKECVTTTNCSQCDANGIRCLGCVISRWGTDCDMDCGNCWNNTGCEKNTGHCLSSMPRCQSGFKGYNCTTPCTGGRYGPDCLERCGNCTQGEDSCNPTSGHCPRDPNKPTCMPGYTGSNCKTACSPYRWGPDCEETCGRCHGGGVCDQVTGECPQGNARCDTGYTGPRCTPCDSGKWGVNCVNTCSENCINSACNVMTGVCEGGCHPGYTGDRCNTDCPTGSWGDNCVSTCSETCLSQPCNPQTGACEGGCQPGYDGKFCQTEFSVDYTDVIVGCVVGVTLTAVLVTAVVLCVRRRQSRQSKGTAVSTENTGVTQDVPHPKPPSRTQGTGTDPVTYYNMAAEEEHTYETVPEKEYDKIRFSRLDTDTDTNYTTLT